MVLLCKETCIKNCFATFIDSHSTLKMHIPALISVSMLLKTPTAKWLDLYAASRKATLKPVFWK